MIWLLMLVACRGGPSVTAVSPAEAHAGETVKVAGEHFADGDLVVLRSQGVEPVALGAPAVESTSIAGTLPSDVAPGSYDVVVVRGGRETVLPGALDVVASADERGCSPDFTANTQLSLARKEIVIDRYYRSGDRETVEVALADVDRVEYELTTSEAGRCSAIFLRTVDGRRIVFVDDAEIDLKERAKKLARDMGKELEITRNDATAMGDDEEE